VGKNAAYDLYLSRTLQHAEIVRAPTTPDAIDLFLAGHVDVLAGIKSFLVQLAKENHKVRVLDGAFMQIKQAMAVPARSGGVKALVDSFINEMMVTDFIREELTKSNQDPSVAASPE